MSKDRKVWALKKQIRLLKEKIKGYEVALEDGILLIQKCGKYILELKEMVDDLTRQLNKREENRKVILKRELEELENEKH